MKRRSIVALCLVAVLAAAATTATTSGATKKATASSITVWLQVDAQSGWPDVVAAANQQFQSDHPGHDGERPVPELGRSPAEVRRDPRGRRRP